MRTWVRLVTKPTPVPRTPLHTSIRGRFAGSKNGRMPPTRTRAGPAAARNLRGTMFAMRATITAATSDIRLGMAVSIWTSEAELSGKDWAISAMDGTMPSGAMESMAMPKMPIFARVLFFFIMVPLFR